MAQPLLNEEHRRDHDLRDRSRQYAASHSGLAHAQPCSHVRPDHQSEPTQPDVHGNVRWVHFTQSGVYGPPITVGNVTAYQLNNLAKDTTYFVSITAVDTAGNERLRSAEVSKSTY